MFRERLRSVMERPNVASDHQWGEFITKAAKKILDSREAGLPDPVSFADLMMGTPPMTPEKMGHASKLTHQRGPGKSSLGKAFSEFLNTPGYNSEEASRHGGHDAYMKHLRAVGIASPIKREPTITGMEADIIMIDDMENLSLDSVADQITEYFASSTQTRLMLNEPHQLTVKKANGQYSKKAHIGGEEFIPLRAYLGKRGQIIYVFRPADAADYAELEVTEKEANELLDGFVAFMKKAPDLREAMTSAKKIAADAAEREKLAGKAEQYADLGFGSW